MLNSDINKEKILVRRLWGMQWMLWALFFLFLVFYTIQKWDAYKFGIWSATIATSFYITAVYGNASWLIPRYYLAQKKLRYYSLSLLFLTVLLFSRLFIEYKVLLPLHEKFYAMTIPHISFVFITNFLAFLFGALLRVSIDHVSLLRKQEEMRHQQLVSELNLLKAQIQPHFLFNTLNNIYYLAYTKNERTAEVVARLSDIMRYFVDEAPKERVPLSTEINFLNNYIALEQIRMLHQAQVRFDHHEADPNLMIPPMLLIPLVENIYKHGIDKAVTENEVFITLRQTADYLLFSTGNMDHGLENNGKGGLGLSNLRKRLSLLFANDFTLDTGKDKYYFTALLKFPVT